MALFSQSKPKPSPREFTATSSIARGQICIVDLAAGTVSPANTTRAQQLEKDLLP